MKTVVIVIFAGLVILTALSGSIMSNVEQPDYKLVRSKGSVEIRDYASMNLAEVEVFGERQQAISGGLKFSRTISLEKTPQTKKWR